MTALEQLDSEHRLIERLLTVLDRWATALAKGEPVAPEMLERAFDVIRDFVDHYHHGKEEDLLFTAMEAAGFSRQQGPIAVMLSEHDHGRRLLQELRELNADRSAHAKADLATALYGFVALMTNHIHKEDMVLYPMARKLLSDEAFEQLAVDFQKSDQALGGDGFATNEAIVTDLERGRPGAWPGA